MTRRRARTIADRLSAAKDFVAEAGELEDVDREVVEDAEEALGRIVDALDAFLEDTER